LKLFSGTPSDCFDPNAAAVGRWGLLPEDNDTADAGGSEGSSGNEGTAAAASYFNTSSHLKARD
jgi:hypothetical protein